MGRFIELIFPGIMFAKIGLMLLESPRAGLITPRRNDAKCQSATYSRNDRQSSVFFRIAATFLVFVKCAKCTALDPTFDSDE